MTDFFLFLDALMVLLNYFIVLLVGIFVMAFGVVGLQKYLIPPERKSSFMVNLTLCLFAIYCIWLGVRISAFAMTAMSRTL